MAVLDDRRDAQAFFGAIAQFVCVTLLVVHCDRPEAQEKPAREERVAKLPSNRFQMETWII
jgi:hypothetical protein